jgi:zinc/manganese transport system substrate-binding protein
LAVFAFLALFAAACGSDAAEQSTSADTTTDTSADTTTDTSADASADTSAAAAQAEDRATVVVTTNILGDVVEQMAGDYVDVVTIMPVGADPHDFQASAQQVAQISDAAVLIVNGENFEEGLLDVIESAEGDGTPVFEAISTVSTIEFGEAGHDDHDDEDHDDHGDEDHDDHGDEDHDDHAHAHDGDDPHFFTDPARMADAAEGIADFLITNLEGVDTDALEASADAYIAELMELDAEVAGLMADLTDDQRVLVTNHEVFGYFADRYDFEVVGTVIPSGSTTDGTSARALAELADVVRDEGVPAIFADTSSSNELAQTLADEVGDIDVVELFSESLGDADSDGATYVDMVRSNAEKIAAALGG